MSNLTIRTNHAWRDFVYRSDVPTSILESDFDYQDSDETIDGFFRYRGSWYHLDMFMSVPTCSPLHAAGFNGYHSDSYFSGVAIRVSTDGERYQVATFYS